MGKIATYPIYTLPRSKRVDYLPGENFHRHYNERPVGAKPVLIYQPLGNIWVAIEWIARKLGLLTLTRLERQISKKSLSLKPLPITNRTRELGVKDSPEQICFPFKAILGYFFERARFLEELKNQTDLNLYPLFLAHESRGICREKAYGRLQEAKLAEFYQREFEKEDFDFYIVRESLAGLGELIRFLQKLSGKSLPEVIMLLNQSIKRLDLVERFEEETRFTQSLIGEFFEAEKILEKVREEAARTEISLEQLDLALKSYRKELEEIQRVRERPKSKIAITGEIFHIEEVESCSADICRELARKGFFPKKEVGIGHYTPRFELTFDRLAQFCLAQLNPFKRNKIKELAQKGGGRDAGGHSLDTIALRQEIKEAQEREKPTYDGVVELLPFGCLPQIYAANVALARKGIPYLRLEFDVQTGKTGVLSRLEAFLDMLQRKKSKEKRDVS